MKITLKRLRQLINEVLDTCPCGIARQDCEYHKSAASGDLQRREIDMEDVVKMYPEAFRAWAESEDDAGRDPSDSIYAIEKHPETGDDVLHVLPPDPSDGYWWIDNDWVPAE